MNNSSLNKTVSQKDDAPETLYPMAEIENVWMESQGEFRRFSPLEWAYLDAWFQAAISPATIIDGIRESFRSFRPRRPGDRIRSLVYCEQAIYRLAQDRYLEEFWQRRKRLLQQEAQRAVAAYRTRKER